LGAKSNSHQHRQPINLNDPANTFKAYKIGATATAMNLRHLAAARKNLIENSMGCPKPSASWSVD
jgi:hypothetical protein